MRIPGFSSTGSKRPEALFGAGAPVGLPVRLSRAVGAEVWDVEGRRYLDYIMALGAVALGYGHPEVNAAAHAAIEAGVVGSLAPEWEERLAGRIAQLVPVAERVRFLKTGAEAVAAAVRLARAATGRERLLRVGYHGWLDWCQPAGAPGVPNVLATLAEEIGFNDIEGGRAAIRRLDGHLAAVVVEPVVETAPAPEWLAMLREETRRVGALLVLDEIKTGFRLEIGGATERFGIDPDLVVLGKAMANGFPLAAVGGRREVMEQARRTWISSTLATESVALAAADTTLGVMARDRVPAVLARSGTRLHAGLEKLATRWPALLTGVMGIPALSALRFRDDAIGIALARAAAARGLLFKRSAYNYVSLAHTDAMIDGTLALLDEACAELAKKSSR